MSAGSDTPLYWVLAALFCCIVAASIVRFVALRNADEATRRQRFASLRTWWMLTIAVSVALLAGLAGICLLLAAASCAGWFEFTRIYGARSEDRLAIHAGYALILIHYLLISLASTPLSIVFLPVASFVVIAVSLLVEDEPGNYLRSAGSLLWGLMFLGFGVSHAAFLITLPATAAGPLGAVGWFLFLVVLTEADDIFQALVGRRFGAHKRHRIAPVVSPNKTWEGFVGGLLAIVILAPLIAPWLTTLGRVPGPFSLPQALQPWVAPILVAIVVSVAGFFGDINMSAIKRDAGVKDSGKLLPGMGGVIDRVDSLTLTAPLFAYFVIWWMP